MNHLVECIPNVSEGCDKAWLTDLEGIATSFGVASLDLHTDPDHNRSVLTLVGQLDAVPNAIDGIAEAAVEHIDLRQHQGVHPRVGALDVVPIVALGDVAPEACVDVARSLGARLWDHLRVPVYLYGEACTTASRRRLETVRRHGFAKLARSVRQGEFLPDVGGPELHPTAGACCVGVREAMVAFNVQLAGRDASVAKRIARRIRESSGGLPGVKALGLYLESAGVAQVSMNLTDLGRTTAEQALDAVDQMAGPEGAQVLGAELVGLAPRAALGTGPERLRILGFNEGMILENRLGAVQPHGSNWRSS